ncbi:MAG: tetratricopeptide repeat protein [Spirochaetia bacterium]|jgi:tetratricopeptide (TPR) repeat protein|nr:tetratricopeptide repeat protein [Spirochaetia bacterium]
MSKKEKVNIESELEAENKLNTFLSSHLRQILWGCIVVVAALVIIGFVEIYGNKTSAKQYDQLYNAQVALSQAIQADSKASDYDANVQKALEGVIALENSKGYVGDKAKLVVADRYYAEKKYQDALDLYVAVWNKVSDKNYLGSVALSSAAATAEQMGNDDKALEYSQQLLDKFGNFAAESPKAMFTIGRIYEKEGKNDLAKAQYQQLADQFPKSEYGKLAKNSLLKF